MALPRAMTSMPVFRPIDSNMNTKSSVTMLPVAPGAKGQPPETYWRRGCQTNPSAARLRVRWRTEEGAGRPYVNKDLGLKPTRRDVLYAASGTRAS